MKIRFSTLRGILLLLLLALLGGYAIFQSIPALRNMLTPASERYRSEGDAFMANGRLAESVLSYRQAVEADPANTRALVSLADAYARQGRLRMAARYREMAARVQNSPTPAPASAPTGGLKLAWQVDAGNSVPTGGLVQDGVLVGALEDGTLLAVNTADGGQKWKNHLPPLASPPAADGQRVYVGDAKGTLHAVNLADGSPSWTFPSGATLYAAPLAAGDTIYCPSSSGTLYALHSADGTLAWKFTAAGAINSTPALSGNRLFFGAADGKLYAVDAFSGALLWPNGIQTGGAVESQAVVVENRVIFGSGDGRVYALDAAAGGQYWRYSTPDAVFAHPQAQNEIVYVASSGSTLSALDLLTGKRIWQAELPAPLRNPPAISEDTLYQLGEATPELFLIDRQSGALRGSFPTGDWTAAGPWLDGGRIFLMGKDGAILAYQRPR